jgi:hypothetical protein
MKHLGDAISQSLSESESIAEAIAAIKAEGYDVFVVLEAKVGFTHQNGADDMTDGDSPLASADQDEAPPTLRMTPQDMKLLKSMHIGLGEE